MDLKFKNKGTYVDVEGYDKGLTDSRLCSAVAESFHYRVEMEASVELDGARIFFGDSPKPAFIVERTANGLFIQVINIQAQGLLRKICD